MSNWSKWHHGPASANAQGWVAGEQRDFFGCLKTPAGDKRGAAIGNAYGIRFVHFYPSKDCGAGKGLDKQGYVKTTNPPWIKHPYIAYLNGGNTYSSVEQKRIDSGKVGCFDAQSKVVQKRMGDLVQAMRTDPMVNSVCGAGRAFINSVPGFTCYTGLYTWQRVNTRCGAKPTSQKNCEEFKSLPQCTPNPNKSCTSNHAVGRAVDIFGTSPGMYYWPDPYYLPNWSNCRFITWMWFANFAYAYNFNNIGNEWWHWQYNNPVIDETELQKLLAEAPPKINESVPDQTTSGEQNTPVTPSESTSTPFVDNSPNVNWDGEVEGEIFDVEEDKYNSLEGVFATLEIERADVGSGLRGLKYLTDDGKDLLVLERLINSEKTKTNSDISDTIGSNENSKTEIQENMKDNSPWSSAPPIEENDKVKSITQKIDSLKTKKNLIDQTTSELSNIVIEYKGVVDKVKPDDDMDEDYTSEMYEKIKNLSEKNSGSDISNTLNSILSDKNGSGIQKLEELQNKVNNLKDESAKLSEKISGSEKELGILTKDIQSSRDSVDSRISNFTNSTFSGQSLGLFGSGSVTDNSINGVIGSGSLSNLREFDLYEVGDKLEKFEIKFKTLKLPKLPDIATLLAGGLSSKNFLSSLSSFSLPGLEELDSLKEIASQAEALYNGDLGVLEQYAGDLGAIDAVNNLQFLKDAEKTLGPIIKEGKELYDSGSKLYAEGQQYYQSASKAYDTYEKLKKEGEELWKEGGKLWNETKTEYDNLKKESAKLLETIKNLPEQAKAAAMSEYNKLESQANQKLEDLQKNGKDQIEKAKSEWIKLKSQGDSLTSQGNALLSNPKVAASNEAQSKIDSAKSSVEELQKTLPPDALEKLESAVDKKQAFEAALNKASIAEKSILSSKSRTNIDKEPKKHFPKNFKPFSEWVLNRENEILNIEFTPQLLLDIQAGNISQVNTNLPLSQMQGNEISVIVDGEPYLGVRDSLVTSSMIPSGVNTPSTTNTSNSEPFIIYRGVTGKINNPTQNQMEGGKYTNFGYERIPTQFKSYFDFGKSDSNPVNLSKLFDGYIDSISSPIDVALLLNPGNVGMFNNIAPYGFGEGSELAAAVTFQKVIQKDVGSLFSKGGVGSRKNPNWAYNPEWAGLYVNFLLEENGIYQSDDDFLDFKRLFKVQDYVTRGNGIKLKNTAPLTEIPKSFSGGVICYFDKATRKGHAEVLLRVTLGGFLTLGGNIKISGTSKFGSTHGFRNYYSLKEFSPSNDVFIIERGKKNPWTTNGRLDGRIKRTTAINEYMSSIENLDSPKSSRLFADAYNILRGHISDTIFTRNDDVKLTDNYKLTLKDSSFKIHKYNDIYLSGSIDLNSYTSISNYDTPQEGKGH